MTIIKKFIITLSPVLLLGEINQILTAQPNNTDDLMLIIFLYKLISIVLSGGVFYLTYHFIIKKITNKLTIKSYNDIIFSGLIFLCILPYHVSYLDVAFCFFAGNVISTYKIKYKSYLFYLNGAIAARLTLFLIHLPIIHYSQYQINIDAFSSATPLLKIAISSHFNQNPNIALSVTQLFLGLWQGSIGETSKLGLGIAFILLSYFKLIKSTPILFGLTASFISYAIFHQSIGLPINAYLPFILMGGFFFGLIFMTTDLFTATLNQTQRCFYLMSIGFLCITYRALLPFPEGMLLAIISSQLLFAIIIIAKSPCMEIWKRLSK